MHPLCIFASFCGGFSPEKERGIYGRKGRGRRDGRKCGGAGGEGCGGEFDNEVAAPQATRDETQCAGEDKKTEARNPKVRKLPSDLHRLKSFVCAVISLIPVSQRFIFCRGGYQLILCFRL